jgi:hypothetical protein
MNPRFMFLDRLFGVRINKHHVNLVLENSKA